VSLINLSIT